MKKNFRKKMMSSFIAIMAAVSLTACGKEEPLVYSTSQQYTLTASASACASSANSSTTYAAYPVNGIKGPGSVFVPEFNTEEYSVIGESVFKDVSISPLSTFSADVDTASYSNIRRMIKDGRRNFPEGAVRAEEMINYFDYNYQGPQSDREPFGVNSEISTCPWNEEHKLIQIGLQTEEIDYSETPDANLVFLIDVSGSMDHENKLPLLKDSFYILLDNLSDKDTISVVTYAGYETVVLEGVKASEKDEIKNAISRLSANGGTNGEGGIKKAYEIAEKNFIKGGNNRIIIASDGDFNVGISSQSELKTLIEKKAKKGVFLSVLGFGDGNYSDARMETLADYGNGNYSYIDSIREANKVFGKELTSNMLTVAKDVKFQVEFNPAYVSEYRLIGYENRELNDEDFDDDTKDAGEVGAGHSVTVLYEIVPAQVARTDGVKLKYQESNLTKEALESDDWLTLSIRYKEPDAIFSKKLEYGVGNSNYNENPSDSFLLAASVAEFAMILKDSEYIADGNMQQVVDNLGRIALDDEFKREFATLADTLN